MRVLTSVLALGLLSSSALAADLLEPVVPVEPVVIEQPVFSWSGFYAGLNAGWYWASEDDNDNARRHRRGGDRRVRECFRDEFGDRICEDFRVARDRGRHRFNNDTGNGPFVGAQIGANYQTGAFVLGIEGDLQYSDFGGDDDNGGRHHRRARVRADGDLGSVNLNIHGNRETDVDWFGTARLRAGVAVGPELRTLLYGTGGFAFGGVENRFDGRFNAQVCDVDNRCGRARFNDNDSANETEVGWVLGAGIEHAFTDNVTLGAEYQYISLGNNDDNDNFRRRNFDDDFGRVRRNFDANNNGADFHTVRLKVNFLGGFGLFGGGS